MRYDFIGLSIQTINGVKNPLLTIVGTITAKKYKFIVEIHPIQRRSRYMQNIFTAFLRMKFTLKSCLKV